MRFTVFTEDVTNEEMFEYLNRLGKRLYMERDDGYREAVDFEGHENYNHDIYNRPDFYYFIMKCGEERGDFLKSIPAPEGMQFDEAEILEAGASMVQPGDEELFSIYEILEITGTKHLFPSREIKGILKIT